MKLLEWIRQNPGKSYNIFVFNKHCNSYVPYQKDYRLLYDKEIKEIHEIKSHKLVWNKKLLMMTPAEPSHNIYMEKEEN